MSKIDAKRVDNSHIYNRNPQQSYNLTIGLNMAADGSIDLEQVNFGELAEGYQRNRSIGGFQSGVHKIPIIMEAMYKRIVALEAQIAAMSGKVVKPTATVVEIVDVVEKEVDVDNLEYKELKALAKKEGINTHGMKKEKIRALLKTKDEE